MIPLRTRKIRFARRRTRRPVRRTRRRLRLGRGGSSADWTPPGWLVHVLWVSAPLWVVALRHNVTALLARPHAAPDVLPAAAAAVAWTHPRSAVPFAVAAGLLADVSSATPLGWGGLRLGLLAAAGAALKPRLTLEIPGVRTLAVIAFALADRVAAAAALCVAHQGVAWAPLVERALAGALWTAALTPLAFAAARAFQREERV